MPRNLDSRVEVLFPILDPRLLRAIRDDILFLHLSDNVQCRLLRPDGSYERLQAVGEQAQIDSQETRLAQAGSWNREDEC
jgi:polyphosphate kinase